MSQTTLTLNWTASTDPTVAGRVTSGWSSTKVYRNGVQVGNPLAPLTTFTDSGLAASTTYTYTLRAVDVAGNESALSGAVQGMTQSSGTSTNPISPARQTDWTIAGATIVHRTNQFGSTIAAYTGTAATINTAITNCATAGGGVVILGAGTFQLSTTIQLKSNVTLRGQGMTTVLRFTGTGGSGFFFGGGSTCVIFQGSFDSSGYAGSAGTPQEGGAPAATRISWTGCGGVAGSYPNGATVINLASAPTGLTVGNMLTLWQADENPATIPKLGFFVSPKRDTSGTTATGVNWQGSGGTGSCMQQRVRVVSISGNNVTIAPGLIHPTGAWKTANTPRVAWQVNDIRAAGVEDMYIDGNTSGPLNQWSCVQFWQASNCWLARCGVTPKTGTSGDGDKTQMVVQLFESRNCTVRDNWIDRGAGGGQGSTTTYGISPVLGSNCLIENNIFDRCESPMLLHVGAFGNVYSYNYEIRQSGHEGGTQFHETGICFNLFEGNHTFKIFGDLFHGTSNFNTMFRCHTFGSDIGFDLQAYHRYHNVVGNVIAAPTGYQTLSTDATLFYRWSGHAFRLGYNGQNASINNFYNGPPNIGVAHDPQVAATLFRWGNYTAADGQTRFSAAEVPSTEAFFPNPVPSSQTLPPSLLYTSRPAFFTVNGAPVTWPPIGPDVTGGIAQGGRVHKLPAQLVYEAAGGAVANFNPGLYGASPATTYSTSFPLTENPMSESGRWIGGKTVGLAWADFRSTPGLAYGKQPGNTPGLYDDAIAVLTGTWGPKQTVTATVKTVNQNDSIFEELELRLRSTITANSSTGYECLFSARSSANAYVQVVRWNGPFGNFTLLDARGGTTYGVQNGDTIKATIVGSTITLYINNVAKLTVTDSTFTTGNPGIGAYLQEATGVNADYGFTSFTATDG